MRPRSVSRFIQEKRRIEREEKVTEGDLLVLQRQMEENQRQLSEKLSRLARLRRQKEVILSKGKEMVIRGLKDLDELEQVEQAEMEAVIDVQAQGAVGVIDWSTVLGESLVADLDFAVSAEASDPPAA
jgi:hypothetical protein